MNTSSSSGIMPASDLLDILCVIIPGKDSLSLALSCGRPHHDLAMHLYLEWIQELTGDTGAAQLLCIQ